MALEKFKFLGAEFTLLEMQTISIYIHGKGRKAVSLIFDVEDSTIHQRMKVIYLKLGVKRAVELTNKARDNGFDLFGNFNGQYLFDGFDKPLPWPNEIEPQEEA